MRDHLTLQAVQNRCNKSSPDCLLSQDQKDRRSTRSNPISRPERFLVMKPHSVYGDEKARSKEINGAIDVVGRESVKAPDPRPGKKQIEDQEFLVENDRVVHHSSKVNSLAGKEVGETNVLNDKILQQSPKTAELHVPRPLCCSNSLNGISQEKKAGSPKKDHKDDILRDCMSVKSIGSKVSLIVFNRRK